jgi:hypothetical protein
MKFSKQYTDEEWFSLSLEQRKRYPTYKMMFLLLEDVGRIERVVCQLIRLPKGVWSELYYISTVSKHHTLPGFSRSKDELGRSVFTSTLTDSNLFDTHYLAHIELVKRHNTHINNYKKSISSLQKMLNSSLKISKRLKKIKVDNKYKNTYRKTRYGYYAII